MRLHISLTNHARLENYAVPCKSGKIHLHSTGHLLNPEDMTLVERDLKLHGSQRMTANKPKKTCREMITTAHTYYFSLLICAPANYHLHE